MKFFLLLAAFAALPSFVFAQTPAPPKSVETPYPDYVLAYVPRPGALSLAIFDGNEAQTIVNDDGRRYDGAAYQTRSFGRITVVALRQTSVYNPRLRPVTPDERDFFAESYELRRFLLASLSPAQWKIAASPEGIGAGDLTGTQAALWERILPQPFAYRRRLAGGEESVRRLEPGERSAVRLRVKLVSQIAASSVANPKSSFTVAYGYDNPLKDATDRASVLPSNAPEIAALAPPPKKNGISDEQGEWKYGQLATVRTFYRLKPTDLRLGDAPLVSLAPPGKGVLTVGTVMERLRAATGLEIYAHKRLSGFAVRGTAIAPGAAFPAGDVLAATAFASQSTVRELPSASGDDAPLYVLTRDREPVGRAVERLDKWLAENDEISVKSSDDTVKQIAAQNVLPLLRFDAGDSFAFSQAWRDRLEAAIRKDENEGYFGFVVGKNELSADQQKAVGAAITKRNEREAQNSAEGGGNYRVSSEKLHLNARVRSVYKVPEETFLGGEMDTNYLGSYSDFLPPTKPKENAAPVTPAGRALLLAADTPETARRAAQLAKRAGASALWLRASDPATFATATKEAKNLPVVAVVSLLDASHAPAKLPRDADLFGSPAPTLDPADPAVIAYVANRLLYLAAVPGLSGMVWENVLPNGYRGAEVGRYDSKPFWTGGNTGTGLGYTAANRRHFLREHGADPADLFPKYYHDISEPESETAAFGADEALFAEWENARRDTMTGLLTATRKAVGKMPVYLAGETQFDGGKPDALDDAVFLVPWDGTDKPPLLDLFRGTWNKIPAVPDAKTGAVVGVVSPRTALAGAELLTRTKRTDAPNLTLVDWSSRTLADIEAELANAAPKR